LNSEFHNDVELVASIPAVPAILDVLCRLTGMGFAAVARMTGSKWVACSIKDQIGFGLEPGSEVETATTICRKILSSREPIVVEDVRDDEVYHCHPAPSHYGFRSIVSFPIVMPDDTLFGTLCAVDLNPRKVRTPEILGAFKLFAEMIAHQLDAAGRHEETRQLLAERMEHQKRQQVLQNELSHRMKNTLAMVQSIVTQSLRNATSLEDATLRTSERIQALGRAQDMLTNSSWQAADIGDVVAAAVSPHVDAGSRFVLAGPPVDLDAQQSMGLSLAIHELATNATKYGALSNGAGHVDIEWTISGDDLRFQWTERDGPTVQPPTGRGFGTRLNERVVPSYFSGKASTRYDSEGIRYLLEGTVQRHS
jgi:two-component sensor histidine kinase